MPGPMDRYKLESIPQPLYWYRLRDTSHSHNTAKFGNSARTIRPYLKQIPQARPGALHATYSVDTTQLT